MTKLLIINVNKKRYILFRKNPLAIRKLPLQGDFSCNKFASDKKMISILIIDKFKMRVMKKLMIIAVLISGMLMPAQIFAKNDRREVKRENRVSVDYNRAKRHNKVVKHHAPAPHKPVVVKHHKHSPAPVVVHHHHPAPVVHHVNCVPPPPPPPVHHHHHHCSEVAGAAAVAVGVVGLLSLLAN